MNKKILAISGKKNSGKTTLIEKLIPILSGRGIRTAIVKHDGHSFDADVKGKDTYRFFHAGACGTAIFDSQKYMVVKKESVSEEFLMKFFADADLLILEGFKWTDWPKFEIVRKGISETHICKEESIIGILSDFGYSVRGIPSYNLNDTQKIADIIENYVHGGEQGEYNVFNNGIYRYDDFDAPKEKEAEININGITLMNIVCTGDEIKEQTTGFLFCEGFISKPEDICSIDVIEDKRGIIIVNVITDKFTIPEYARKLPGFGNGVDFGRECESSCMDSEFYIESNKLTLLYKKAQNLCSSYNRTGGTHWSALCTDTDILYFAEDISRHNSMDKVIGKYIAGTEHNARMMITSGRVSSEMMKKCCKLSLPVVCSLSAPTDIAVSIAEERGIAIVGYLKADRGKIYSCGRRIK